MLRLLKFTLVPIGSDFPPGDTWNNILGHFWLSTWRRWMETMDAVNIFQPTRQSIEENDLVQKINSQTEYPWGKAYQSGSMCVQLCLTPL